MEPRPETLKVREDSPLQQRDVVEGNIDVFVRIVIWYESRFQLHYKSLASIPQIWLESSTKKPQNSIQENIKGRKRIKSKPNRLQIKKEVL